MWENFDEGRAACGDVTLHYRRAGQGAPLVLLHGYPQNGNCWHALAPRFAERFDVIVPDLRGYGRSDAPEDTALDPQGYTKRTMARDIAGLLDALGIEAAHILGHDRGARVAYRMALDLPERVRHLGILEILPTAAYWDAMDAAFSMAVYHWTFLAQPHPVPEMLIAGAPRDYVSHTLASWTLDKSLAPFAPEALESYLAQAEDPARIHAMCADYRAGARTDRALDEEDRKAGRRIAAPLRCLFSEGGFAARHGDPEGVWRGWAESVETGTCRAGHFVPEENPDAVLDAMLPHLAD